MSVKSMDLVWWHKLPCMGVSSLRVLLCCRYQCSNEAEVWCQWRPVWESPQAGWLTPHTDSGLLWALRYLESQVPPPLLFHLLTFWGYEKVMSLIRSSTPSVYLKVKGWIISESLWGLPFLAFFVGTLKSRNDTNMFPESTSQVSIGWKNIFLCSLPRKIGSEIQSPTEEGHKIMCCDYFCYTLTHSVTSILIRQLKSLNSPWIWLGECWECLLSQVKPVLYTSLTRLPQYLTEPNTYSCYSYAYFY